MVEKLIFFGLGFLVARYLITRHGSEEYLKLETQLVDKFRNQAHDVIKKYAPDASDEEIGNDLITATLTDQEKKAA